MQSLCHLMIWFYSDIQAGLCLSRSCHHSCNGFKQGVEKKISKVIKGNGRSPEQKLTFDHTGLNTDVRAVFEFF